MRKHVRARQERARKLGEADAANRCAFCRRELPKLGALLAELSGTRRYCNDACLADDEERTALLEARRA